MHGYLRHLANFAYIVDAGSLSGAAKALGTTPSGMSDSVRILEAHLGSPLLERHQRGVSPTALGERIHAEASTIVRSLALAMEKEEQPSLQGALRISMPGELAQNGLERGVQAVRDIHPEARIEVFVEDAILDYSKFTRDLYVRATHESSVAGLTELARMETEIVLIGNADLFASADRGDLSAWSRQTLLVGSARKAAPTLPLRSAAGASTEKIAFEQWLAISDAATRLHYARAGAGLMVCLKCSVEGDLAQGRLIEAGALFTAPKGTVLVGSPHQRPPVAMRSAAQALISGLIGA